MTVFIRETSGDDLTPYLRHEKANGTILLRRGRSNTVRVNGEHFLTDVRALHVFESENGSLEVEFQLQYSENDHDNRITLHNVETVKVEWMGWSHKFDSYYNGIYDAQIDIDNLKHINNLNK